MVISLPALPFAASLEMTNKLKHNIAALAGIIQSNMGTLKKVIAHIGQLNNNMKQGLKATKITSSGNKTRGKNYHPWINEALTNANDIK